MSSSRWPIAWVIAAAISYFDRQTLSVAVAAIQRDIPITNTQFSQLQAALRADSMAGFRFHGWLIVEVLGRIPIAGGEHGFTVYEFRELLADGGVLSAGRRQRVSVSRSGAGRPSSRGRHEAAEGCHDPSRDWPLPCWQ